MEYVKKALTEEQLKLFHLLLDKYGAVLSVDQTAKIVKKSKAALFRERKAGIGMKYIQDNANSKVRYPLQEIVRYLSNTDKRSQNGL